MTHQSNLGNDILLCGPNDRKRLSERDFRRLSEIISTQCGIKMPVTKKIMLEARLRKRLKALSIDSYKNYCEYLLSPHGMENELLHMIDAVTTNKTDFFREARHFDYLTSTVIPNLILRYNTGVEKNLVVWSAGCSTGEEPYTIAMVLSELRERRQDFNFEIVATDISTRALKKAAQGIYEKERVESVPLVLRKKYLMRSKDKERPLVRIVPELRQAVTFRRLNFMSIYYEFGYQVDIIFCRNVFIYFDRQTQETLLKRFYEHLIPGGYLFMGHCETLSQMKVPFVPVGSMIYRKPS